MRKFQRFGQAFGLGLVMLVLGVDAPTIRSADATKAEKSAVVPPLNAAKTPTVEKIAAPIAYKNLSVFLLHGKNAQDDLKLSALEEAIEKKKIIVHETKNVNQLSIENVSGEAVFVHMGDIVRGGSQDRLIVYDMIVPPQSGKLPLPSFCVESGRWSARGGEDAKSFNGSKNQAGKAFKYTANAAMSQGAVWEKVARAQKQLERSVEAKVVAAASPTSLQLTLEDKKVLENVAKYEKAFADMLQGKNDAIGVAVAVNGKVESADVYASAALFEKFAKKLVAAACVDALGEFDEKKKFAAAATKDVEAFLGEKLSAPKEQSQVAEGNGRQQGLNANEGLYYAPRNAAPQPANPPARQPAPPRQLAEPQPAETPPAVEPAKTEAEVRIFKYENDRILMIESRERKRMDGVLHRSYLAKEEKQPAAKVNEPEPKR